MTDPLPEWKPTSGASRDVVTGCLWERAAVEHAHLHGYLTKLPLHRILTDAPCWANPVLNMVGIACHDACTDKQLARMGPLLARCIRAERRSPDTERRINARVLCGQARKVLHLARPGDRRVLEQAIATREAWLRGETTEIDCLAAAENATLVAAVAVAGAAVHAAVAAAVVDPVRAAAAVAAVRAAADTAEFDPIDWLSDALDMWEKACAEEGAMLSDGEARRLVDEFVQANGG